MAPEWEMGFGTAGMAPPASSTPTLGNSPTFLYGLPSADTLRIDDLLDFSNHDVFTTSTIATAKDPYLPPPPDPSSAAGTGSISFAGASSSSSDHHHHHYQQQYPHLPSFTDDIYIPSEEAAELEWLSNFVDDSFSDVPYPSSGHLVAPTTAIRADPSIHTGRGARSKRSRGNSNAPVHHHHPTTWSSLSPPPQSSSPSTTSSSSSSDFPPANLQLSSDNNHGSGSTSPNTSSINNNNNKGRHKGEGGEDGGGGVRRCTHCASEKTPQWRTGPLGPKTLCNACGVRYKSGRLVAEYRPAASPTFVLTQHSNSHRKVLELRRQKELIHIRHDAAQSSSPSADTAAPFLF